MERELEAVIRVQFRAVRAHEYGTVRIDGRQSLTLIRVDALVKRAGTVAARSPGGLTSFDAELPLEWMQRPVGKIDSAFFTMDVASKEDGSWVVIELGDGQVAGLPSPELAPQFFRDLREIVA